VVQRIVASRFSVCESRNCLATFILSGGIAALATLLCEFLAHLPSAFSFSRLFEPLLFLFNFASQIVDDRLASLLHQPHKRAYRDISSRDEQYEIPDI